LTKLDMYFLFFQWGGCNGVYISIDCMYVRIGIVGGQKILLSILQYVLKSHFSSQQ